MRGLSVPDRSEDFTADPVELFFDLAFVFAFSQLVSHLVHHPTWVGFGQASLLFSLLWMGWSQYTWSANALSGNGRPVRLIFLVGTAVSVPMAASIGSAFDAGGTLFAGALGFIFLLALWMAIQGYETNSPEWRSAVRYSIPSAGFVVVLFAGSFFDGTARVVVWTLAFMLFLYSTISAGDGEWVVRSGHFAERHGLIIIIALGEVIVAIGIGVVSGFEAATEVGAGLGGTTLASLAAAAVFACTLWWSYFDRVLPALEHKAEGLDRGEQSRFARDVYTYCHLFIVGGVIVAAAAVEEIALHPDAELHREFRIMFFAGLAFYFGGIALAVARAFGVVARERLVGVILVGVAVFAFGGLDGWILLVIVDGILLVTVVLEHVRIEKPDRSTASA